MLAVPVAQDVGWQLQYRNNWLYFASTDCSNCAGVLVPFALQLESAIATMGRKTNILTLFKVI